MTEAFLVLETPPSGSHRDGVLATVGVWLSGERSIDSIHETISRICLADGLNSIDADTRPFAKYPVYLRSFNHIEFPLGQIQRIQ